MVRFLRLGATTAVLLALAGCGQGSKLYSPQDAKRAFAEEDFVLVPMDLEQPRERRSRILVPKSAEPFTVVVARTTAEAKDAYRALNRQSTRLTFDLRERNVLTISETGLTHRDKARLRRAMHHFR
jgi:predicted small lipoprotein YifL